MSAKFRPVLYGPDDMFGTRPVIGYVVSAGGASHFVRELPPPGSYSDAEYAYLLRAAATIAAAPRLDQLPLEVGPNFSLGRTFSVPVSDAEALAWVRARVAERHPLPTEQTIAADHNAVILFPWWTSAEVCTVGRFGLLPVVVTSDGLVPARGGAPLALAPPLLEALTTIVSRFRVGERAVSRFTLLTIDGRLVVPSPDDDVLGDAHRFGRNVAMAALAARRFHHDASYTSTLDLELVIQKFQVPVTTLTRDVLRRDGTHRVMMSTDLAVEHLRPEASPMFDPRPVDVGLLEAFEALRRATVPPETVDTIDRAIEDFLAWNRDDGPWAVRDHLVRAVASLLALFELREAIEGPLTERISRLFTAAPRLEGVQDAWRRNRPGPDGNTPIVRAWVQELCRRRGASAHGYERASDGGPRWSSVEHLLFAAWLFPFLLKDRLQTLGVYAWTEGDRRRLATFEVRLALSPERLARGWQGIDGWLASGTASRPDALQSFVTKLFATRVDSDHEPEPWP